MVACFLNCVRHRKRHFPALAIARVSSRVDRLGPGLSGVVQPGHVVVEAGQQARRTSIAELSRPTARESVEPSMLVDSANSPMRLSPTWCSAARMVRT